MVRLTIEYTGPSADQARVLPSRVVIVEGDADAPFATAAWAALGPDYSREIFLLRMPDDLRSMTAITVTDKMTLGEVADFADGEALPLTNARIGGQLIFDLLTMAGAASTLWWLYESARALVSRGQQFSFRKHRDEARQWANAGVDTPPAMSLVRLVKAQPSWDITTMMRMFEVDRQEARALLQRLNYVYEPSWDTWYETPTE